MLSVEMHFLPDVQVRCPACHGRRFKREVLAVKYKGYDIAQVLDLTIAEALPLFAEVPAAKARLALMAETGMGYLQLGQPASTFSGGEAQRVKLAKELARALDRAHALPAGRADHRPAPRRYGAPAAAAAAPGRRGQHGHRHRAQPGRGQVRRLGHRPGPGGRRRGRADHRRGHARDGGGLPGVDHRADAEAPDRLMRVSAPPGP